MENQEYTFSTDYVTFDIEKASVCLSQIEDSPIFSVEIFPLGQTDESYEEAEFSAFMNMVEYKQTNVLDLDELKYPYEFTEADKSEFIEALKATIADEITLVEKQ